MTRRRWSRSDMQTLRTSYGRVPARIIAQRLGRTTDAIRRRAFEWGLQIDPQRKGELMRAART